VRRRVLELAGALPVALLGFACNGIPAADELAEPIQIAGGQFIAGPLPGSLPADAGARANEAGAADAGVEAGASFPPLTVTSATFTNPFIVSGISGTGVSGLTTDDAVAVGVALGALGTGYWVVPTQQQDVEFPGQRDFGFTASFNPGDAPGNANLRVVALGASGSAGVQFDGPLCIESRVPDNGHACNPLRPVPTAVFALRWDTAFDLDLTVLTPSGRNVNPKGATTTEPVDGGAGPTPAPYGVGLYDPAVGVIDRDSMGGCVVDGWREEDLVFLDYPETGLYEIYANPFESCGQPIVHFTLTIYAAGASGKLEATFSRSGELLASQTTGGAAPDGGSAAGLFVAQKEYE